MSDYGGQDHIFTGIQRVITAKVDYLYNVQPMELTRKVVANDKERWIRLKRIDKNEKKD